MVIIYPALTSSTVSGHVLPGICKALEKFIIVYRMDSIIEQGKTLGLNLDILKKGGEAAKIVHKSAMGSYREQEESEEEQKDQEEQNDQENRGQKGKEFGVMVPKLDQTVSVEPTWMLVTTKTGTQVLGIKVIAFPVKSDKKLAELILDDRIRYGLDSLVKRVGRGAVRASLNIIRRWGGKLKLMPTISVTGDPAKDVLLATSSHGEDIFVILNYMDIPGDEFFRSAQGVKKLFSLGWGSFAIVDDVNKRATFCMKEFKGLCSSVSLANIYASIGKEQHQVYKDAEEVKASSSPFFHMSTSIKRLASESIANEKLEKYLVEL
jgi:hypothetical protein